VVGLITTASAVPEDDATVETFAGAFGATGVRVVTAEEPTEATGAVAIALLAAAITGAEITGVGALVEVDFAADGVGVGAGDGAGDVDGFGVEPALGVALGAGVAEAFGVALADGVGEAEGVGVGDGVTTGGE
jgi:hypothetical protein